MSRSEYQYRNSNRLPIPKRLKDRGALHMLYKGERLSLPQSDLDILVKTALRDRATMSADEIEVSRPTDEQRPVVSRIAQMLGLAESQTASLLYCGWAPPHDDMLFAGVNFISVVIHTGPSPYRVFALSQGRCPDGDYGLRSQTIHVSPGDVFHLDPTTPHCAFPVSPHQDSFLVLLQFEITVETAKDLADLVKTVPPAKEEPFRGGTLPD